MYTTVRLMRVAALQRAIQIGCEEGLTHEEIFTLSDIIGDEAHKAQTELDKWFDGLVMEK